MITNLACQNSKRKCFYICILYEVVSLTRGINIQREIYLVTAQMLQQEGDRIVLRVFLWVFLFIQSEVGDKIFIEVSPNCT